MRSLMSGKKKKTSIFQYRRQTMPLAREDNDIKKNTDVIKLASYIQEKFNQFSQWMSVLCKSTESKNKQSEMYPSVFSVSNKKNGQRRVGEKLTLTNHKRRARKKFKTEKNN